jgi:hypothetical protein
MGIPESESVESSAKDDDLPNPSFHSHRQSVFRNPASRGGEQTSDAGQGVFLRELKHVLFGFTQSSWQMGHRRLSHDRAPDERLVVGRSSGLCGWLH